MVLATDATEEPAVKALRDALNQEAWCELRPASTAEAIARPQCARGTDCILLASKQAGDLLADGRLAALVCAVTPTPVLVLASDARAVESRLFAVGADDCLDPATVPTAACLKVIRRSIERARQRVHVETARQQYRALYDNMPVAACRVDTRGELTSANREFLALLGAQTTADVGEGQFNGLLAGMSGLLRADVAGATPEYCQAHVINAVDGSERHVIVFAHAVNDSSGRPVMEMFLTDVTEREAQTRRIVAAEDQLRQMMDNVPVMMLTLDRDGSVRAPNRQLADALGLTRSALNGAAFTTLLHPDSDVATVKDCLARVFAGGSVHELALSLLRFDGAEMECLFSARPAGDGAGGVERAHAMLVDVTERNRAQRERDRLQDELQLHRKLESIGELAAGIAHEINTPAQYVSDNLSFLGEAFDDLASLFAALPVSLTALRDGGSESIAETLADAIETADLDYVAEEIPAALAQARDGIGKIREIVLALKEFSHPGSGEKEMADINQVVERTITVARNEWKYVAQVTRDFDGSLPAIRCFPSAIGQVVLNLLVNASHAIADARDARAPLGRIVISTRCADDASIQIRIADNGPGIPEEIRHKIFDPFFTTKEVGRGTGQGLAISRSVVVEQHGGSLDVESAPGEGTAFTVTLPIDSAAQTHPPEVAA